MSTAIKPSGLFELTAEMTALIDEITANDGVLTDETEATLKRLTDELGSRVDRFGAILQTLDLQVTGYRDRVKAFMAAIHARENAAERVKSRLLDAMQQMGTRRIQGELYTARVGESQAVQITDYNVVPVSYIRQPAPEIDKAAIKKALKDGQTVPGAALETRSHVVIK